MTETRTDYRTATPPAEPTHYKAIGNGVFAFYGEDISVLIIECHAGKPAWRGLTYTQACRMAELVADTLNQKAAI